tara:strand:- start:2438 stop:3259 length:822 start_codon:yes stop_codon:yes gene_type:complete
MNRWHFIPFLLVVLVNCKNPEKKDRQEWIFENKIELPKKSRPLALVKIGDAIWFSDPENLRLLKIDVAGKVLDSITGIKRPMNIDLDEGKLYIPEFLTDTIWIYENGDQKPLELLAKPKAPAGLAVNGDTVAIADFYNHRIILQIGKKVTYLGKEGHDKEQLYYPTDVKISNDKIYIADAYNNRVHVFDFDGKALNAIGELDNLNVASGLAINENYLAVTDQENSRVLIYDLNGSLIQILTDNINYPTDVLFDGDILYITNFKENALSVYFAK